MTLRQLTVHREDPQPQEEDKVKQVIRKDIHTILNKAGQVTNHLTGLLIHGLFVC